MEKMDGKGLDVRKINLNKLKEAFPECIKDGMYDLNVLKALLGEENVALNDSYSFTWNGKTNAIKKSIEPSSITLIPRKDLSKNWEKTENIYIEGDNLDALKAISKTYHNKINMIYIDPPYNTGHDFVYKDSYKDSVEDYLESSNQSLKSNPETSGRYHTDWLNMIYPRLRIAKELLCDDGLIFISIDDNEVHNLKKVCDEIFGESNFLTCITRPTGTPTGGGFDGLVNELDYILVYAKDIASAVIYGLEMDEKSAGIYNEVDENGNRYLTRSLRRTGGEDRRQDRPSMYYPIISPDGEEIYPIGPTGYESRWICSKETTEQLIRDGMIEWKKTTINGKETWHPYQKYYLENRTKKPGNIWTDIVCSEEDNPLLWSDCEGNKKATRDIRDLFDGIKVFETAKPLGLMEKIIKIGSREDSLILDFFAGSATTAHAVMKFNAENKSNRKYIIVQIPEATPSDSEAYKAGYKTICELGEERIRRAGDRLMGKLRDKYESAGLIVDDTKNPDEFDIGFKVFSVSSTNIVPWDGTKKLDELNIFEQNQVFKEGRTKLDVAYEVMLKYGVFDKQLEEKKINGKDVYCVDNDSLVIFLEDEIDMDDVKEIIKLNPTTVVFKESGFADDNVKMNAEYTLRHYLGEDQIKVLCI